MLTGVRTTVPAARLRDVPVAVSTAVAPLLRSRASGTVLACFPTAVYVLLPGSEVLALVTSDGLRLPDALVVAATSRDAPFAGHGTGRRAHVTGGADGALVLDGVNYRPVRTWQPRERTAGRLQAAAVARLGALLDADPAPHAGDVASRLHAATARLGQALAAAPWGTGAGLPAAADALLGLGPGLTPAGDDVLAGVLVTSAQLDHALPALAEAVLQRRGATTALSADLLAHAAAGRAAPSVLALLDALVGQRPVAPALAALRAVGATSGVDTATGVLLAARARLARPEAA